MIEISKEDLKIIIGYLEMLEKVFKKGGPRCSQLLKVVRQDIKYFKEKE